MSDEPLIPATMLFRISTACWQTDQRWDEGGLDLEERYRLPALAQLDGRSLFADLRLGWNADGLLFTVDVTGKRQTLWCRSTQLLESDSVQFWVDTRDTHTVHRASRFCHWFLFLPTGGRAGSQQALATMLKINRAKEDPRTLNQVAVRAGSRIAPDGYQLWGWIPGKALSGWDPSEHRRIGFNYAVVDRELGWQTLGPGPEFPIAEDPSLWQTLELR